MLKEAMVNSRTRLAFEEPLARELGSFTPGAPILMENSDHVGALQAAGIPLKQTIGPGDYYLGRPGWRRRRRTRRYVITMAGDELSGGGGEASGGADGAGDCVHDEPALCEVYQSDRWKK